MKIILEPSNSYLDDFCKHFKITHEQLLKMIEDRYLNVVEHDPKKVKVLKNVKHHGLKVYEFKVPTPLIHNLEFARIAYTEHDKTLIVIYATHFVIKEFFVREISKTKLFN